MTEVYHKQKAWPNKNKGKIMKCFNMRILCYYSIFSALLIAGGCATQELAQRRSTARYKMAVAELSAIHGGERQTALRRALAHLNEAIMLAPSAAAMGTKASILLELGMIDHCKETIVAALAITADRSIIAQLNNTLACAKATCGETEKALAIFDELVTDPTYQTPEVALCNKGRVLLLLKKYNAAQNALEQATHIAPQLIDAHYLLAVTALQQQNFSLASAALEQTLFYAPEHQQAQQLLHTIQNKIAT